MDRGDFVSKALSKAGSPYIWASKGPDTFDCSGLVTWAIWAAGGIDRRIDYNANRMMQEFDVVDIPATGDLVFYGQRGSPDHASHVMIFMGCGCVYGSSGGNQYTTKPTPGQCVKYHRSVQYRPDFLGYRKLPDK